jgi:hypothetical protein
MNIPAFAQQAPGQEEAILSAGAGNDRRTRIDGLDYGGCPRRCGCG